MAQTTSKISDAPPDSSASNAAAPTSEADLGYYRMSTTAGVGAGDYVAINGTAIATILLGLASGLAFMSSGLLLLPLAGIVCGILALRQITASNGTQTGKWLAVCGLLLSVVLGGIEGTKLIASTVRERSDTRQIEQIIAQFGDDILAGRSAEAYAKFSAKFRSEVTQEHFVAQMASMRSNSRFGNLKSITSNGLVQFLPDAQGTLTATSAAMLTFDRNDEPMRRLVTFLKTDNGWIIDGLPDIFPPPTRAGPGAHPSGPAPIGPVGPPAPGH